MYDFKQCVPFADEKSITREELQNVLRFVNGGQLIGTGKKSTQTILDELAAIGYDKKKHHDYTYMYCWSNKNYAPDTRHVYILELDEFISLL